MKDNGTPAAAEIRKKAQRLVSRWSELNKENVSSEASDADRRKELWLTPPTPYPGLRSFVRSESELFFARRQQVDGLIQRLTNSNIMVVLGGSGCGKSSLVRAGLIPRLSTSGAVPGRAGRWYVLEYHPGRDPNSALVGGFRDSILEPVSKFMPADDPELGRRALIQALDLDKDLVTLEPTQVLDQAVAKVSTKLFLDASGDVIRSAPLNVEGLFELAHDILDRVDIVLSRGARSGRPNLLILIDQFEEAFRPEVTIEGLRNLCALIKATFKRRPPSLFLAITLRSEELHRCAEAGLANIVTETAYLLGPLDDEEARREIIVQPARAVFNEWLGMHRKASGSDTAPFDPDVVQVLMDESQRILGGVGYKSDYLPLLQHALQRIWDSAMSRWSRELAGDGPLDLSINMDDLTDATTSLEPALLARCLNRYVNEAYDEAVAEVAAECWGGDIGATEKAKRVVRTAFSAMARQDDRGNWARRSVSPKWIAELLDDVEPDPANRNAADVVLRIFHKHGYLNRSVTREGEEFDVSHEALIRNWTRYDEWLRELGTIGNSVREVVNDLESRKRTEALAQARRSPLWEGILDWVLQRKETRATALITDQHRDNLGKVVGTERTVSIGLAAALLADSERRRSARLTGSSITLDEPPAQDSQQRNQLEMRMRERIEEVGPDWNLADIASKRFASRLTYIAGFGAVLLLGAFAAVGIQSVVNSNLAQSQDRLQFGAVAAATSLDASRWLEAPAFELERVHNRVGTHLGEESWNGNDSAIREMGLSLGNWQRAARQFTGAVIFREVEKSKITSTHADCVTREKSALLRHTSALTFGIGLDKNNGNWGIVYQPANGSPAASLARGSNPEQSLGSEGVVCLGRDVPLAMIWPEGANEPQFWMIGLRCQKFGNGTCISWLPEAKRLRVTYSRKFAGVHPPWTSLWVQGKTGGPQVDMTEQEAEEEAKRAQDAARRAWVGREIFEFEEKVDDATPRIGFAFHTGSRWIVADTTPGALDPYIIASDTAFVAPSQSQPACKVETIEGCTNKFPMDVNVHREETRLVGNQSSNPLTPCAKDKLSNCLVSISVEANPSDKLVGFPIWKWSFPSTPVDSIGTDGKTLEFRSVDGLWRRGVVGVNALAKHVGILAGSMSSDPQKIGVTREDLSEICIEAGCQDWDAPSEPWKW